MLRQSESFTAGWIARMYIGGFKYPLHDRQAEAGRPGPIESGCSPLCPSYDQDAEYREWRMSIHGDAPPFLPDTLPEAFPFLSLPHVVDLPMRVMLGSEANNLESSEKLRRGSTAYQGVLSWPTVKWRPWDTGVPRPMLCA